MSRVVVIGESDIDLAAKLEALGVATISTRMVFQSLANALADPDLNIRLNEIVYAHMRRGGAPKFGSDRPYLKKKKGRS